MVWTPTQEEGGDNGDNNPQGLLGLGKTILFQPKNYGNVTYCDNDHWYDKPQQEANDGYHFMSLVAKGGVVWRTGQGEVVKTKDLVVEGCSVSKNKGRGAHQKTSHPNQDAEQPGNGRGPMLLGLDWEDHQNAAIKADCGQQKHAGVHVEVEKQIVDFAHVSAENPVEAHGGVGDVQGQEDIEQEVSGCQVEEPDRGDRLLHLEDNGDDQTIAQQTQEAGDAVDDSSDHLNDGQGFYLVFFAICVSNRDEVFENIV